jgi:hypothetical protein
MRVLSTALLLLISCCIAAAQNMTDREFAGLKGKVQTVETWSQKLGPDGNPVAEATADSKTIFDENGNRTESTTFGELQVHTTYFLFKGELVSKSEISGKNPLDQIKVPKGVQIHRNDPTGPFDEKYKYKYDEKGRIVEISEYDTGGHPITTKYVYDDAGRKMSETEASGGSAGSTSYKYDQSGNLSEAVSQVTLHVFKGFGNSIPPVITTVEKHSSTASYSDYAFDKQGNWTKRTANYFEDKGKVKGIFLHVRYFTYY